MEQQQLQGEIHVELNSEITLLKDLNDFLMLRLPVHAVAAASR